MRLNGQDTPSNGFTTLASFAIITAVLYFAKDVLIPLALAFLLSFLLGPLVVRLARWGLGKASSVLLVVAMASVLVGVIGWLVLAQLIHLVDQLPKYQANLHEKVLSIRRPSRNGLIAHAASMLKEVQKELDSFTRSDDDGTNLAGQGLESAVPVEIRSPRPNAFQLMGTMVGPVLKPLAIAAAVVFFVILMLFQREDLRERFLKLVSGGELNVATQAVDDAAQRVSRYLLMQLVVNMAYGVPIGVGLFLIGVPNAFLWGLLATLLRFVPFIGVWIAASFPIVLAFAVDPGWLKVILTVVLFGVVELLCVNLAEPLLYGASTGVSNIALLVAAIFWTWLWGAVGLLLSTPLTVCLMVLGKYVPGVSFLSVLLGSEPVLEPHARFYQRMLAMDEEELIDLSDKFLQDHSVAELYDSVLIPALGLAEQDRHKGTLAELRQNFIVQNTRELIEMLGDREPLPSEVGPDSDRPAILCLPARDESDELAALMLQQLLRKRGLSARALPATTLARDWLKQIRRDRIQTVCVSSIPPFAVAPARLTCKRLRREFPHLNILVGIWNARAQPTELAHRLGGSGSTSIATRLPEALVRLEALLKRPGAQPVRSSPGGWPAPAGAPPASAAEPELEEIVDRTTREAAKLFNVPVSLVSLIDTDQQFWKARGGLPPHVTGGGALHSSSLYGGSAAEEILDVEDVTKDARFANDPVLQDRGIRFYAGVPLRTKDGHVVGSLCVTDTEPHLISDRDRAELRILGDRLIQEVEHRKLQAA
jgi:predicted PurR-regulated permease PerM